MEKRYEGKIALVFGAASGIGKAVALRFAKEGAKLVVSDINNEQLSAVASECSALGTEVVWVTCDISSIDDIKKVTTFAVKSFSKIDIMVNAAGIVQSRDFLEVEEKDWDRIIAINQKGTAFACQIVGRQMVEQVKNLKGVRPDSTGKIVNFSSIAGRRGRMFQLHYAASKAAIISITQSTAYALAEYGINVNAVSPSVVKTPMWDKHIEQKAATYGISVDEATAEMVEKIPLRRIGTSEDISAAVSFLCSSEADFITGQTLNVDGGFEMN